MAAAGNVLAKGWRYAIHSGSFRKNLRLEEFGASFVKSEGNVLIRMQAAPVSELDLAQIRGTSHVRGGLPAIAGCTGVGVVTDAAQCKSLKTGDRVVLATHLPGSWTTHQVANERNLIKVPETIPIEYASLLALGPLAAYRILKAAKIQKGETIVVNGANTLVGMSIMQIAKHFDINCVGVMQSSSAESELQLEKMKQMGMHVLVDPIADVQGTFGNDKPRLAVNLVGGYSSAHLASLLCDGGQMVTVGSADNDAHLIGNADLVDKNLSIQGFSVFRWLQAADRKEVDAGVAELCDLIGANKLKAFILRHELANAQIAIEDAQSVPYNVVLLHEGSEKTWADKARDEYMKIDEQLQHNWNSSAAAQEPYLKAGREHPWVLSQAIADPAVVSRLDSELKAKLASVQTVDELSNLLGNLSPADRAALGAPSTGAITMTAEQLTQTVSELENALK